MLGGHHEALSSDPQSPRESQPWWQVPGAPVQPCAHRCNGKLQVQRETLSLVWWHRLVISALGRLRQGDYEFQASLCWGIRPCLKEPKSDIEFVCVYLGAGGWAGTADSCCVWLSVQVQGCPKVLLAEFVTVSTWL